MVVDRRLGAALGAAAVFAVGFALGWLVRGERAASGAGAPTAAGSADTRDGDGGVAGDGVTSGRDGGGADGGGDATRARAEAGGGAAAERSGDSRGDQASVDRALGAAAGAGAAGREDEPPRPRGADAGVAPRGRLAASAVQDVVRAHRDELGFCFAWQLHQRPDLGGRVVMEFEIGPEGRVTEARIADDVLGDETVLRCFVSVTRRMEFPAPEGGSVTVRYPFVLSSGPAPE